jgi:uncharacterized protein (DUF983 family)
MSSMAAPSRKPAPVSSLPPTAVLIRRALTQKCPVCGRGAVFKSHFRMNRECPNCHVTFWKDPGESLGAMYVDYVVATVAFLVAWLTLDFTTHVSDPMQFVIVAPIAVTSILLFYPISRSIWTVLVYVSGGIEKPRMRAIRGGKAS